MVRRAQTLVQLTDELVEQLSRVAARRGTSRSQVIRELLEAGLRDERRAAVTQRLVAGYRRAPQADAWGDLEAWTAENTRRNLAALAAEESEHW